MKRQRKQVESDEDSSDNEEIASKLVALAGDIDDDDDESDSEGFDQDESDDEDEEEIKSNLKINKTNSLKRMKKELSDEEDDDSDDSSEADIVVQPSSKQAAAPAKRVKVEKPKPVKPTITESVKTETFVPRPPKPYDSDTPAVTDPVVREEIADKIKNRIFSTLVLFRIPIAWSYSDVIKLHPNMLTCRIPWNTTTRKNKGRAFLEFPSKKVADLAKDEIPLRAKKNKMKIASENPDFKVNVDDYNCRRLIVFNIPWRATEEKIKSLFPTAVEVNLPASTNKRKRDKREPGIVYILFANEQDAIAEFDKMHGAKFSEESSKRISVHFHKKIDTSYATSKSLKELVLMGVQKKVTDDEIRGYFPQVKSITRKLSDNSVTLLYLEPEDAQLDYKNALPKIASERKWRLTFGRQNVNKRSNDAGELKSSSQLFVKNIQKFVNEKDMKSLFPSATHIHFPMRNPKQCIGFAIITFANEEEAEKMLNLRNNNVLREKQLQITFADSQKIKTLEQKKAKEESIRQKKDSEGKKELVAENQEARREFSPRKPSRDKNAQHKDRRGNPRNQNPTDNIRKDRPRTPGKSFPGKFKKDFKGKDKKKFGGKRA